MSYAAALLAFIADWTEDRGGPPTILDCAHGLSLTPEMIRSTLGSLRDEGLITKVPDQNAVELHLI